FPILAGDRTAHAKTITHAIIKSKGVIGFRESGWWIAEPMKMVLSLQPDLGRFLRIRASGLDVEAIRQDVLCRCFLNIEDYIGIDPALAMTRMAHEARNQMKRHVRKKLASSQNSLMETVSHDGEWPSEIARTIESLQALKSELEDLSSTERALVLLYISDGKSAEEVALASNLHLRTVYRKINSAVVRLKRAIWNN
ncbi:MAG: RNA polymerase sigma factor, partial [Phycisphaerae bacterium]